LSFQLQVPELALVRFVVEDHDHTAKNNFVAQYTLPFTSLCTGVCVCVCVWVCVCVCVVLWLCGVWCVVRGVAVEVNQLATSVWIGRTTCVRGKGGRRTSNELVGLH